MSQPNAVQFKISHIFVVTAWVATVVTLCRLGGYFELNGIGVAGTSTALTIVWLNAFGWLKCIQSRKWHVCLVGFSFGLFIVSLFLPAWELFNGYPGWKVATLAYRIAFDSHSGLDMRMVLLIAFPMRRVDAMVFTMALSFWATYNFVTW